MRRGWKGREGDRNIELRCESFKVSGRLLFLGLFIRNGSEGEIKVIRGRFFI